MNMIVCVDENWGIAKEGKLLAHLPTDLKWFKTLTKGHIVVMGRKTLESLPGQKPLKDRVNIVLTHDPFFKKDGCFCFSSEAALIQYLEDMCDSKNIWIIGGASLYKRFWTQCKKIYVTKIEQDLQADLFIDIIDQNKAFVPIYTSELYIENDIPFRFWIYERTTCDRAEL